MLSTFKKCYIAYCIIIVLVAMMTSSFLNCFIFILSGFLCNNDVNETNFRCVCYWYQYQ